MPATKARTGPVDPADNEFSKAQGAGHDALNLVGVAVIHFAYSGRIMVGVFLSHSSKDKPFVRDLADALEAGGEIKVWLDEREIDYGENIVLKIADGLDADFVLLILSPDSVDSKWVKEEWTDAYWEQVESQHVKVAGVLYRDCRIPRLLRNKKYFDLRTNQPEGFRLIKTWLLGQRPPAPPVVHLPQRPPLVIGREQEIEELRHRLQEPGSVAYVSGLAGRGKTTLALEYAHRYQRDFEAVHWLPCQGRTLVQMAGELAWQLGLKLDGELDAIIRQLTSHCASKRCLLVLDNVEDDTPAQLMPAGRTSVLITTRFTNLRFLRGYRPLNLPLFTEEQCFELFREVIGKEEVGRHEAEARSLFQRLGYLPIGIAVAAGLVREDVRYTISGMAKNLPADAYALLKEAVVALSPVAQTLMAAMAVCAPEGFRLALAAEVAELDEASSLDVVAGNTLTLAGGRVGSDHAAISTPRAGARGRRCIRLATAKACGMHSEGVRRLGEQLASVRRGHGRLAGGVLLVAGGGWRRRSLVDG